ncbi:MAG: hypothetical protein ABIR60_12480, partial [Allosphingosinicella sp.]
SIILPATYPLVIGMLVLLYVVFRIACDTAGLAAGIGAMAVFGAFEAVLFWGTRARAEGEGGPG